MHSFPPPRSKGNPYLTLLGVVLLGVVGFVIASFVAKVIIAVVSFIALPVVILGMCIAVAYILDQKEGKRLREYRENGGVQRVTDG